MPPGETQHVSGLPPSWRYPHDAFREALSLYYTSSVRPDSSDTGRLLLGLWAYVEGMVDGTTHGAAFSEAWNELTDEWTRNGSASGVGSGMTPQEYEARQLVLIVRFAKKAGIFETPDASYGRAQLDRELEKYGASRP